MVTKFNAARYAELENELAEMDQSRILAVGDLRKIMDSALGGHHTISDSMLHVLVNSAGAVRDALSPFDSRVLVDTSRCECNQACPATPPGAGALRGTANWPPGLAASFQDEAASTSNYQRNPPQAPAGAVPAPNWQRYGGTAD